MILLKFAVASVLLVMSLVLAFGKNVRLGRRWVLGVLSFLAVSRGSADLMASTTLRVIDSPPSLAMIVGASFYVAAGVLFLRAALRKRPEGQLA